MTFDNIADTVDSLSEESNGLSENEVIALYIFLTGMDTNALAGMENLLNRCQTNNTKLTYLRELLRKSGSEQPIVEQPGAGIGSLTASIAGLELQGNYLLWSISLYYEMPEYSLLTFHLTTKDREIWVRYGDTDAVCFGQKELEKENIRHLHDLKRLVKGKLQSLKGFSEDLICLNKGDDILKSSTSIADLFNTEDEALVITVKFSLMDP